MADLTPVDLVHWLGGCTLLLSPDIVSDLQHLVEDHQIGGEEFGNLLKSGRLQDASRKVTAPTLTTLRRIWSADQNRASSTATIPFKPPLRGATSSPGGAQQYNKGQRSPSPPQQRTLSPSYSNLRSSPQANGTKTNPKRFGTSPSRSSPSRSQTMTATTPQTQQLNLNWSSNRGKSPTTAAKPIPVMVAQPAKPTPTTASAGGSTPRKRGTTTVPMSKGGFGDTIGFHPLEDHGSTGYLKRKHFVIRNTAQIKPLATSGLLDNCLMCLPARAVDRLRLTPNIEDKGCNKELWLGRMWHLRCLLTLFYEDHRKWEKIEISDQTRKLEKTIANDPKQLKLITKLQNAWRGAMLRRISSFGILDRLEDCVKGFVIFMHGSGGMTYNNLRFARALAGMDFIVLCPDDMASSRYRHRDARPLATFEQKMDYWDDNLIYSSDATGEYNYSTQVEGVLKDPEHYKELYEKVYRERSNELHYVLGHLPKFANTLGVFIMGTSEGAMTVARFNDQKYGPLINGRIISAFSVEYCYFTPTPEAGKIGGSLDVPTLNLIGSHDQYFGNHESIAQLVAKGPTGYGSKNLTGNAYQTMKEQGVDRGLVCVFEQGKHDLTVTHDNALREIFQAFFTRPNRCHQLDQIWLKDPSMWTQIEVTDKSQTKGTFGGLLLLWIKKSEWPQTVPRGKEHTLHLVHSEAAKKSLKAHMDAQEKLEEKAQKEADELIGSMKAAMQGLSGGAFGGGGGRR